MNVSLLQAYLPMDRRHALAGGSPLPDRTEGTALFADISGFTPLTEALVSILGPRRGVEELARLLNTIYDALVAPVHTYGGSVIGFSGDGMLCWFDDDPAQRATVAALAMQQAMSSFAALETPGGTVAISLKVGLAAGPARRFLVGNPQIQRIDVLAGLAVDCVARAEQLALKGEVLLDPRAAALVCPHTTTAMRQGYAVAEALNINVPPAPWPLLPAPLTAEQLRSHLPLPVYRRLTAGQGEFLAELRPAVAFFLRFSGIDYNGDDHAGDKLDAYVTWVQQVLARYDGHLLQLTTGDKGSYLYNSFGTLSTHEDDSERAVAAAMVLCSPPPQLSYISETQIGLSQGRVRAGSYGSPSRQTYAALGDEVNVAARLMMAAPPGEIRCSQRIFQAASRRWVMEALPPIHIKGKREPFVVYRPLHRAKRAAASPVETLIGRKNELETQSRLLQEAQSGRTSILILEGEAGIGKSRLVAELSRQAQEAGFTWLLGAGQSIEQYSPYRAWRDILASLLGLDEVALAVVGPAEHHRRVQEHLVQVNAALAERAPLLNDILGLDLPETELTRSFDPKLRHESLTALVVDLVRGTTAVAPLALVLDDAQWLDSLSWELALAIAQALSDQPFLLVLSLRPLVEPLRPEYTALVDLSGTTTLRLTTMPATETVALAAARLGVDPVALPAQVAQLIREHAGGNPFFTEEIAYALRDTGVISVDEGVCSIVGDLAAFRETVPDTVEGIVLTRIDRLPPEQQLTLKVAAVIGRGFFYRTLHDVHPQQIVADLLSAHMENLSRRDLTSPEILDPELRYIFKHIITQQVAYDTLLFSQRRALHRTVATWYERVYAGNLSPYYSLLTHHANRAEDEDRERHYARLAGEHAAAQFANTEAVNYLSRALDLTPKTNLEQRYELLLAREQVLGHQGAREAQAQDLAALEELVKAFPGDRRQAEVDLEWTTYYFETCEYPAAIRAAQNVLARASSDLDRTLAVKGLLAWGQGLWQQGDYVQARQRYEQALSIAQASGDLRGEADSLLNLGNIFLYQGSYDQARIHYEQSLSLYERLNMRKNEGSARHNLGLTADYQGDYTEARMYYEQALHIYREVGFRRGQGHTLNNFGGILRCQGYLDEARDCFEQARRIFQQIGDRQGMGSALANLGRCWDGYGDYAQGRIYYQQALEHYRQVGHRRGEGATLADLAASSHRLGDDQTALDYAKRVMDVAEEIGERVLLGQGFLYQGYALEGLGHLVQATAAYQQALELGHELRDPAQYLEPLAGLTRIALNQGNTLQAHRYAKEILGYRTQASFSQTENLLLVYLSCYHALQANRDALSQEILARAHQVLQERMVGIGDEQARSAFLHTVPVHREIATLYEAMVAQAGPNKI